MEDIKGCRGRVTASGPVEKAWWRRVCGSDIGAKATENAVAAF